MNEVRCDEVRERLGLLQGLTDESNIPHPQVPEPTVNQLRRGARRAGCEVAAVEEGDVEAELARERRDSGADDTASHDENVEPL